MRHQFIISLLLLLPGVSGAQPPASIQEASYALAWPRAVESAQATRDMMFGFFTVSPNGRRFAYLGLRKDGTPFAVIDGLADSTSTAWLQRPIFSPDSRHVMYVTPENSVVVDGDEGPRFDGVASVQFSNDSQRHSYIATTGTSVMMVIDGLASPRFEGIVYSNPFSPDGLHTAYCGVVQSTSVMPGFDREKGGMVVDGVMTKIYEGLNNPVGRPVWSTDSSRLAYWARDGDTDYLVIDGSEKKIDDVHSYSDIWFSPDLTRTAYLIGKAPKQRVVVDGRKSPKYRSVSGLAFSPDSQHVAYVAESDHGWAVVLDGTEHDSWEQIISHAPAFSPNSQRLAYVALRDGAGYVVTNESLDGPYDGDTWMLTNLSNSNQGYMLTAAADLAYSPDSTRLAYIAIKDKKLYVVVEGSKHGPYRKVGDLVFSPDSQHLAYLAQLEDGSLVVVMDFQSRGPFKDLGRIVALPGTERRLRDTLLVTSDKTLDGFSMDDQHDATGRNLIFSQDSKHVAFRALDADGWRVHLGDTPSPPYDRIVRGDEMQFDEEGRLHFLAWKSTSPNTVWSVTMTPPSN